MNLLLHFLAFLTPFTFEAYPNEASPIVEETPALVPVPLCMEDMAQENETSPIVEETPALLPAPLCMEDMAQDFVLETKQIQFEEYPTAFNPSVAKWQDKILLSFRIRDPQTDSTDSVGLVWLDETFSPVGTPQVLDLHVDRPSFISKVQDPRLIVIDGHLYMAYSNALYRDEFFRELRRMYLGEITYEANRFRLTSPECLYHYTGEKNQQEKNWAPFAYQEQLLLSYSLAPHRVLWPVRGTNQAQIFAISNQELPWSWGEIRGGTPAILDGDQYIGIFHSSLNMASTSSQSRTMQHYFMGAYTFTAQPPFRIKKISPAPIAAPEFYEESSHHTWEPLRFVFPGGLLIDGNTIWVFYGRQDREVWLAKLDKQKLLDSLIPTIP